MRTQRCIAYVFAAGLVSLLAGPAMADDEPGDFNAFLQGTYQVSGTGACATGFPIESIGSGPTAHITFAGVITYDGHGLATGKDQGLVINGTGAGTDSAFGFDEACEFSYKVAPDGSFSQTGSCTSPDGSAKVTFITWTGQIGDEGEVLITNQVGTTASVLEVPPGNIISYRRCGIVGTAVRIHPH